MRKEICFFWYVFFSVSLLGVFGQTPDLSGDWIMRIGNGDVHNVNIEQTGDTLIFWLRTGGETLPFTGKAEGGEIIVSGPVRTKWPESKRACYEHIIALEEGHPQYKTTLRLKLKNRELEGEYRYPKDILCEHETISVSVSAPFPVHLTRVNYIYWIRGKKLYKAPVNQPERRSVLTEAAAAITSFALGTDGKRIYWSEGKNIYSIQQNGKGKQRLTTAETADMPHSIVVDTKTNTLIWAEGAKIMVAGMQKDSRKELIKAQQHIRALVIDSVRQKLYWLLHPSNKIRSANLDGSDIKDVTTAEAAVALAVDSKEGYLYWTTPNAIKRISLNAPKTVEDVITAAAPLSIAIDHEFDALYWTTADGIRKANRKGIGEEQLLRAPDIKGVATGPGGPALYDSVNVEGSLLIASAAPGKSLLQQLVKNDTYYDVLLSEYEQPGSAYNTTDARLVLLWGTNFPKPKEDNIAFTASDPALSYREFNTWSAALLNAQKEAYSKYALWLAETKNLNKKTWDTVWEKVKSSLGVSTLNSIKSKDYMLVLAVPEKGMVPGIKSFTMNDAEAHWYLNTGSAIAKMRFLSALSNGREEAIASIFPGAPFFIELHTNRPLHKDTIPLSYFINTNLLELNNAALKAVKYGTDGKTYRTTPIVLQDSEADGKQLYPGTHGYMESLCKAGSIFKASVADATLFNNSISTAVSAPLLNPVKTIWQQSLGEAVALTEGLNIPESEWESAVNKTITTLSGAAATNGKSPKTAPQCTVTLGDYAAMLLLKKYFIRRLKAYYNTLEKHKDDALFQYGFWKLMADHTKNPDIPPGNLKVIAKNILLSNVFSKDDVLSRHTSPRTAKSWIQDAKKEGFIKYIRAIKNALDDMERMDDKDIEKLIRATASGFQAVAPLVLSDLQEKSCVVNNANTCNEFHCQWKPDTIARTYVTNSITAAAHCAALKESQASEADIALAAAGLAAFPLTAYNPGESYVTAVYYAALGSGEIYGDNVKLNAEGQASGTEKHILGKLKETPAWARLLSYFGEGLGISETAFNTLEFTGKMHMQEVYSQLPFFANHIDRYGALEAYQAMSGHHKINFLFMLEEAENLKELPAVALSDIQRHLLLTTAQFTEALNAADKSNAAADKTDAGIRILREALPSNLKDSIHIIRDNTLSGNTVYPEYELDASGFLTHIRIRAGEIATAQNIAAHIPVLTKMKAYEQLAGAAGNLYRSIKYWYGRSFNKAPTFGTPARNTMQDIQTLHYHIENRLDNLVAGATVDSKRITAELQELSGQLAKHQSTFRKFMTNPRLARGGMITEEDTITAEKIIEEIETAVQKALTSGHKTLTARAQRIQKAQDFLSRTPVRKALYDAVIAQAAGKRNPEIAKQFLDRLSHFSTLSPEQLSGMHAFTEATGDVASLSLILQSGIPTARNTETYTTETLNTVLALLYQAKDKPKLLTGISAYLNAMGKSTVISVDKLRRLTEKPDIKNDLHIFETIATFKASGNFSAVLTALSSADQNRFTGAMGQLTAARELAGTYGVNAITFKHPFYEKDGTPFQDIDILVRTGNGKIAKLVTCKAAAHLAGFFTAEAKRQFARELLLAYHNDLTPLEGMVWMISKTALKSGKQALQLKRIANQFLTVFSDDSFKDIRCKIDEETLKAFKKAIQEHPESIFQFF